MAYNRIEGSPKFFIDAALLARQWGQIEYAHEDKFFLNPSNVTDFEFDTDFAKYIVIDFKQRYWINSLDSLFILGHNFHTKDVNLIWSTRVDGSGSSASVSPLSNYTFDINGWHYIPSTSWNEGVADQDYKRLHFRFNESLEPYEGNVKLGDISPCWSFQMPHSPDLELTQTFSNESIKTQTTKSGSTLTSSGWNKKADWIRPAWSKGKTETTLLGYFQGGRRSWSLKFSYVADTSLFAENFHNDSEGNFGIFESISGGTEYSIKDNFIDKVFHGTNSFQLPCIFQPNSSVEEFAICRITNDSATFTQVANNVYDVSLDIVEVF